jgi:hypothetical protein
MSTTTKSRGRVKPERRCRISAAQGDAKRILRLLIGTEAFLYWVEPVATDWGKGFRLEKFESGDVYHVHLDPALGHSCECKGFLRWGKPCKHISAVSALVAAGRL